ncbi:hypothetical protein I5M27_06935 [Adhaeribacter sp. BT258]|uniref:Uncharacterized protein n=1 Tax=Adhaeribacter terrigena TaxID=2793070 RepID=A0ABS1BZY5_9BACT|nr:Ig-like domain-containing protein [Adhaeribacter terrigena]MBK0402714.1 hypothetical protein [Adhaeribacter terrigena]
MKNQSLFTFFAGLFAFVFLLSGCDKFEEDTSPMLATTLVLRNDTYTTQKNQTIQLQVLANDSISGQTSVEFGKPSHGTLQATGTPGSVFYQPETNFVGRDTVRYKVCIGQNCISASVFIIVQADPVNPCTVSVSNDSVAVIANQSSTINILQNDVTCNNIPSMVQAPQFGRARLNGNNQLEYIPNPNYTGPDEVHYKVGAVTGKVSITVKPVIPNCTLTANPDMVTMPHNKAIDSVAVDVLGNDVWCTNAPAVSVHLINQSSHGTLMVTGSGASSRILYITNTPLHNITDSFQYRICQGSTCTISTVTVNIQ